MKLLLVGGTFDKNGGKPSSLIRKIFGFLDKNEELDIFFCNGGYVDELHNRLLPMAKEFDLVGWFANVPNEEDKIRDVKSINPKAILITSKRNDNGKYSFAELINRSLSIKANLTIEFSKNENNVFNMMLFDPLGNQFYNGADIEALSDALMKRMMNLISFTRQQTIPELGDIPEVPDEKEFFSFAQDCSEIFHNLINPSKDVSRFLGNMSFRCQNGFPSFRGKNGIIYVSKRNIDKREINKESFVPSFIDEEQQIKYYGVQKPSVDTPIQLNLYKAFPWVNYMIHAHCYFDASSVEDSISFSTFHPIPCGALEEVGEIIRCLQILWGEKDIEHSRLVAVNLIGHGCLLMASDVKVFENLKHKKNLCFYSRPMPEQQLSYFKKDIENEFLFYGLVGPFDSYFDKAQNIDDLENSIKKAQSIKCVIKNYSACGSTTCCEEKRISSANNIVSKINAIQFCIKILKVAYEKSPERIFVNKNKNSYHIIILRRDIDFEDIHIFLKS